MQDFSQNNNETLTGGIFYCRDSAGFSVSAPNKLSCNLTAQCFEIGNKTYRQNVSNQVKSHYDRILRT